MLPLFLLYALTQDTCYSCLLPCRTSRQPAKHSSSLPMTASAAVLPAPRACSRAASEAPSCSARSEAEEDAFAECWAFYSKLVARNFCAHAELFAALERLLRGLASRPNAAPLDCLELGCGDCALSAAVLRAPSLPLASFVGVDVLAPVLRLAAHNLAASLPCPVKLVADDMLHFVAGCGAEQYDVALAAYSLHHLR